MIARRLDWTPVQPAAENPAVVLAGRSRKRFTYDQGEKLGQVISLTSKQR
jgi:hypothetical protein